MGIELARFQRCQRRAASVCGKPFRFNKRLSVGMALPLPLFLVSVADKGVTGAQSVSVDSAGDTRSRLRLKPGKTRSSSTSVASKGLSAVIFSLRAPEKRKRPDQFGAP